MAFEEIARCGKRRDGDGCGGVREERSGVEVKEEDGNEDEVRDCGRKLRRHGGSTI